MGGEVVEVILSMIRGHRAGSEDTGRITTEAQSTPRTPRVLRVPVVN